jgi:hypothetical protein
MSNYNIKKYDGSNAPIPELVEYSNTIDTSTSLAFFSKGSDYGQPLNKNFLFLLEHGKSNNINKPNNPIMGQLWYNKDDSSLNVFNGSNWDKIRKRITSQELYWSGSFQQSTTGSTSSIIGSLTVSSTNAFFNSTISYNTNNNLSGYTISGNIPNGLTLNIIPDAVSNAVNITLSGTVPASTPSFNFNISFTRLAFSNVTDITTVTNFSNTIVVAMSNAVIPPSISTTTTTSAPSTPVLFEGGYWFGSDASYNYYISPDNLVPPDRIKFSEAQTYCNNLTVLGNAAYKWEIPSVYIFSMLTNYLNINPLLSSVCSFALAYWTTDMDDTNYWKKIYLITASPHTTFFNPLNSVSNPDDNTIWLRPIRKIPK